MFVFGKRGKCLLSIFLLLLLLCIKWTNQLPLPSIRKTDEQKAFRWFKVDDGAHWYSQLAILFRPSVPPSPFLNTERNHKILAIAIFYRHSPNSFLFHRTFPFVSFGFVWIIKGKSGIAIINTQQQMVNNPHHRRLYDRPMN